MSMVGSLPHNVDETINRGIIDPPERAHKNFFKATNIKCICFVYLKNFLFKVSTRKLYPTLQMLKLNIEEKIAKLNFTTVPLPT